MAAQPQERVRKRLVWFSPLLFVVALSPALLGLTCQRTGDTRLASLEIEVLSVNRIVDFDPMVRVYDVWLPEGATTATVRAVPMDGVARVNWYASNGDRTFEAGAIGLGGGEVTIDLPPDGGSITVGVFPSGGATDGYVVYINPACSAGSPCSDGNDCTADFCDPGTEQCVLTPVADDTACDFGGEIGTCVSGVCEMGFPCTEQGILDAIALGGGPHTFACNGPTTVTTQGEIFIYNDVILDGEGNLTIDGNDDHRVLSVVPGVTAELIGMTVSGGYINGDPSRGGRDPQRRNARLFAIASWSATTAGLWVVASTRMEC